MRYWKTTLVSLLSLPVALFADPAQATCEPFDRTYEDIWCYPPISWDRNDGVVAVVGIDSSGIDGMHWIGWQNRVTGECHWDPIGDANTFELGGTNPGGPYVHVSEVTVMGNYGSDILKTVSTPVEFCGYEQGPLTFNNPQDNVINFVGDDGVDVIYVESNGANASIDAGAHQDYVVSFRSDVYIEGGPGNDTIAVHGNEGSPFLVGSEGDDSLSYSGTETAYMVCSEGTDQWCGGMSFECETAIPASSSLFGRRRCP